MARTALFEWKGREFDPSPKSSDWYWAVGIIAVAGAVAAILFQNYLFAVLILIAASVVALHGAKQPPEHTFRLVEQGLYIGEELHPFERMMSFTVLEDIEGELPPILSIKTENWLAPHLMIPLQGVDVDAVYAYFLERIDESEHRHTFSDLLARWMGF